MFPLTNDELDRAVKKLLIADLSNATIRQICSLAKELENVAGERMVHLEIGNPGLKAEQIGIEAEIEALRSGVANQYPNIAGIRELKDAANSFVKAFMNVEVPAKCVIPTVGSMQGSFTLMLLLSQRIPGKDTMLFINPGFAAQRHQAKLLGIKEAAFDIYNYRGKKLEEKLESILKEGNITGIIYSNPNNPAWTNLTEEELEIIGRMATKYDAIVLEDLAYFGMDFRSDFSVPNEPPFVPTVARYTDNYILLLSGSKMFSYAGQRIGLVCMSDSVFERKYDFFDKFYEMPKLGDAYVFGILYCCSSGTSHSAQVAMAEMLDASARGELKFVEHCRDYMEKGARAKEIFTRNGFKIVYKMDGDQPIGDGFFFTVGYDGLGAQELLQELMKYGIASISLKSCGSQQPGVRVCVSMIPDEESYQLLDKYLNKFNIDHRK